MKRLLATLPLLAAITVATYSMVHDPAAQGFTPSLSGTRPVMPVQVLPEGHPPLLQHNPHLPEGHPPIPGSAAECPGFRGEAGGNTDELAVDAQELIST
jgi:hypothetical protein